MGNGISLSRKWASSDLIFFFSAGSSDREKMEKNHTHITVELDASLDGITAREKKVVL